MSNLGKGLVVAVVVMAQCCVLQPALGQDRKAAVNADVTIEDLALCNDKIEDQFRHALAEQGRGGCGIGLAKIWRAQRQTAKLILSTNADYGQVKKVFSAG